MTYSEFLRLHHLLESEGYVVLPVRTSDFPIDFIAIKNGKSTAYRCKFHGKVPQPEMQKLIDFAEQTHIKAYIAKENGAGDVYFKHPSLDAIKNTHIQKIDNGLRGVEK